MDEIARGTELLPTLVCNSSVTRASRREALDARDAEPAAKRASDEAEYAVETCSGDSAAALCDFLAARRMTLDEGEWCTVVQALRAAIGRAGKIGDEADALLAWLLRCLGVMRDVSIVSYLDELLETADGPAASGELACTVRRTFELYPGELHSLRAWVLERGVLSQPSTASDRAVTSVQRMVSDLIVPVPPAFRPRVADAMALTRRTSGAVGCWVGAADASGLVIDSQYGCRGPVGRAGLAHWQTHLRACGGAAGYSHLTGAPDGDELPSRASSHTVIPLPGHGFAVVFWAHDSPPTIEQILSAAGPVTQPYCVAPGMGERVPVRRSTPSEAMLVGVAHELASQQELMAHAVHVICLPDAPAQAVEEVREDLEVAWVEIQELVAGILNWQGGAEYTHAAGIVSDFRELVRNGLGRAQPFADERGVEFDIRMPEEPLPIDADPDSVRFAVYYLLRDAVKHGKASTTVWVTAKRDGDVAILRIRDDPMVLPPEDAKRPGVMSSGQGRGAGLSLTVADAMIRHNAGWCSELVVDDSTGHVSVECHMPLAPG